MASGRDFSAHQRKIVNRYYEHHDTIMLNRLGEIVSDLYLATDSAKTGRLWESVAKALKQLGVTPSRIAQVCGRRDVTMLAGMVTELQAGPPAAKAQESGGGGQESGVRGQVSGVRGQSSPAVPPAGVPGAGVPGAGVQGVRSQGSGVGSQSSPAVPPSGVQPAASSAPAAPTAPTAAPTAPTATPASPTAITPDTLKSALKAFRKRLKLTKLDDESQIGSSRNPLTGGSHSTIAAIQPPSQFPSAVWEELARQGKLKASGRGFYTLVE